MPHDRASAKRAVPARPRAPHCTVRLGSATSHPGDPLCAASPRRVLSSGRRCAAAVRTWRAVPRHWVAGREKLARGRALAPINIRGGQVGPGGTCRPSARRLLSAYRRAPPALSRMGQCFVIGSSCPAPLPARGAAARHLRKRAQSRRDVGPGTWRESAPAAGSPSCSPPTRLADPPRDEMPASRTVCALALLLALLSALPM